ncbi:MAG: nickel pincer cofactor biosynthesis protein LarC [Syntrophomonadaceae bacterium]|nr:nickel pincer cofactor biosynthesis protein LarC [Syntrophomonadaceae bacterium]
MEKILYFDCYAGISGDMTVAALLDLGVDPKALRQELEKLHLDGWEMQVTQGHRNGLRGIKFDVRLGDGSSHRHNGHTATAHRNLGDIEAIIDHSSLKDAVKDLSKRIFSVLAAAEAHVHGKPITEVHFHEVGAVDSIIDIVGTAVCLDILAVDSIFASPVNLGGGLVNCAHGTLPVPAPATLEILQGVPVFSSGVQAELVTPTGAAILKTLVAGFVPMPRMTVEKTGYGMGSREIPEMPNMLRAMWGVPTSSGAYTLMETNIDDMNPEIYSYLLPLLLKNGALDVWLTSIIMKKNRPGTMISVLCRNEDVRILQEILLKETTTLGVRCREIERVELERIVSTVDTSLGQVEVKRAYLQGELLKTAPEYEGCRRLAEERGLPLKDVYNIINRELKI